MKLTGSRRGWKMQAKKGCTKIKARQRELQAPPRLTHCVSSANLHRLHRLHRLGLHRLHYDPWQGGSAIRPIELIVSASFVHVIGPTSTFANRQRSTAQKLTPTRHNHTTFYYH
jgi:hypothetical protein